MVSTLGSQALKVRGNQILNADGQPVVLRGFGLGGWMNMENFITGYSANEQAQRDAIRGVIGDELYLLFFDAFWSTSSPRLMRRSSARWGSTWCGCRSTTATSKTTCAPSS